MTEIRLNPLDAAWILTETRAAPNHVGGLLTYRLPDGAPRDFLSRMMREFRDHREFRPPWNLRLKYAVSTSPMAWVEDDDVDLEYHVRHAALPWPGGERELGELVGRLQSTPIDLTRPPWECTLIEGLEGDRFALFIKMHHSLIDGVSGMKLLQKTMSPDRQRSLKIPPFWASGSFGAAVGRGDEHRAPAPTLAGAIGSVAGALLGQVRTVPQLVRAFGKFVARIGQTDEGLAVPFDSPRSVLNGRVREKRRFATQQFPIARLRAVASAADCTLNDVVLAVCAGALRRYLLERGELPEKSLTAGIPVSVRPNDDEGGGNAISFIVARLGTDVDGVRERLEVIRTSVRHAKAHVQSLPRQAMLQYTMLLMAPTVLTMLTGTGGRTRPMFNVTISNVPGPEQTLYFRGAELLAIYPASIATHGQALNITCESYAGTMNFGFTGCHATVPSLQKIAVYAEDSLKELEAALLRSPTKAKATKGAAKDGAKVSRKGYEKAGARAGSEVGAKAGARPGSEVAAKTGAQAARRGAVKAA